MVSYDVLPSDVQKSCNNLRAFVNELKQLKSSCIFFIDEIDLIWDFEKGDFALSSFLQECMNSSNVSVSLLHNFVSNQH